MTDQEPTRSYWNHRIVRRVDPTGSISYGIHEVYYNVAGESKPAMTVDSIAVTHWVEPQYEDDPEAMTTDAAMREGLRETFRLQMLAFDKPTLDYDTQEEIT